jgi:hypothetical protein
VTAGVVVFLLAVVALHLLQPGLDPLEQAVSYYVHGAFGSLLTVGLIALGLASLALALALRGAVAGPESRAGRWLLGVWGVGVLLGGVFRADPPGQWNEPPSVAGLIHGNAALVAFLAFPIAALCLTPALRASGSGRSRAGLLLVLAVAAALSLALFAASLVPVFVRPGPPILLGLTERVLLAVYSAWLIVAGAAARG